MVNTKTEPDIIDCDDLDVECVGMKRAPPTYIMLDDEDEDSAPVASSSRQPPSLRSASSSQDRRANPLHEALRGSGRQQQARGSRSQMEPPTKKRATNAAIAKLNKPGPSNRKRKEPEVIEISSDEAEGSSSKRTKLDGRESADPILLAPREPPLPDPETDSEDEYAISAPPVSRPRKRIEYVDCRYGPPERIDLGRKVDACIFKRFQASKSIKAPPRVRLPQMCQAPLKSSRSRPLYRDLAYNMLGLAQSFRRVASGSITKVVQVPGTILVGSTTWQGNPDYPGDEEEQLGPENMAGNLLMWHKDDIQTIDGHWATRATSNGTCHLSVDTPP
ncbi:hypothetical protein BV22DRAFT_288709 [Leucogyrophana mollusca]|uniref:Uncharacterized protein n=1 Tax=Leucogyrophana mollusca TaxID=85980 RepID=A0ACB8BP25_9AGAM|nr:hypothetical protein BV22DRAFT_288709 [Leucogyrophana mollusca]